MSKHKDTQMNNLMAGINGFVSNEKREKAKANKSTSNKQNELKNKHAQTSKLKAQYQNRPKAKKFTKSSTDYPWTSLLGVNETAVLFAIQHVFSCKSRTEALAKLIQHNNLKITGQKKNDFNTLKRLFITENRPKAEKRYEKYFGKK